MTPHPTPLADATGLRTLMLPLVLVVDDDPDMRVLVSDALGTHGYRTLEACNGREALELIEEQWPQLVLLDMRMPVMDGWEFAERLTRRYGGEIPVVVMTAAEDAGRRAREIGASESLGKPFDLDELFDIVDRTVTEQIMEP